MVWQEAKPSPTDIPNLELPSLITGNKTVFRTGAEKHLFWTDSSTNSIGIPRLSDGSAGPGAARAYYDTLSAVSRPLNPAKPLNGRLFVTSNSSHLFGYIAFAGGAGGTAAVPLGNKNAVAYLPSFATIAAGARVLVQFGSAATLGYATLSASSIIAVTFPTAYSAVPSVQVEPLSVGTSLFAEAQITSITVSGFSLGVRTIFNPASSSTVTCLWRSFGTVVL